MEIKVAIISLGLVAVLVLCSVAGVTGTCGGCTSTSATQQSACPATYAVSERQSYKTYTHKKCGTWGWGRCTRSVTSYRTIYKTKDSPHVGCCSPFKQCGNKCFGRCTSNPCRNGGACTEQCDKYTCTCRPGYTGLTCQTDINECASNPCRNGGTCWNQVNGYTCTCQTGCTGTNCQIDIDECSAGTATCEQLCENTNRSYQCHCAPGYSLNADGRTCTELDECESNPCLHGATCNDLVNSCACVCQGGYTGSNCQTELDECESNPCLHGATCKNLVNSYSCTCQGGYTGGDCQTDIDECSQGSATCEQLCENTDGSYQCHCLPGYSLNADGRTCTDVNECESSPCMNEATCNNLVNGYNCTCQPGYTGFNCQSDIDECSTGTSTCEKLCENTDGSYQCHCMPGYSLNADGRTCTDVNECESSPCMNEATCNNLVNGYNCTCQLGYTGFNCQTDIDECSAGTSECEQLCENLDGSYQCHCAPGYSLNADGRTCSDIDECAANPCQNEGVCTDLVNTYSCACVLGFMGQDCITVCGSNEYCGTGVANHRERPGACDHDALPNEFPWQVSLQDADSNSHACGGAIIGPNLIITSAECTSQTEDPSRWKAVVGEYSLTEDDGTEATYSIESFSFSGNLALWRTKAAMVFTADISPVCLTDRQHAGDTNMWSTGWGYDNKRCDVARETLGKVHVELDEESCEDTDHNSTVCVSYAGSDPPGCIADLGGPLVQLYNGVHTLCGIHSGTFYKGNSVNIKAMVYTDVLTELDWLMGEIAKNY